MDKWSKPISNHKTTKIARNTLGYPNWLHAQVG